MPVEMNVPVSTEAELDREMSAIIAKWVDGVITREQVDRFQELSLKRATLMNGGARLFHPVRRRMAAA